MDLCIINCTGKQYKRQKAENVEKIRKKKQNKKERKESPEMKMNSDWEDAAAAESSICYSRYLNLK